ncbi:uncharacterized protein [Littorina saxatilis]|uniref:Uncharacterized protein n=1 Tax=Littorina saxatilis TaxID=31220 RepID=A0AAN9ALW9_9CAEN
MGRLAMNRTVHYRTFSSQSQSHSLIFNHRFGSTSRPPEKPEIMCIIHTAPVFQFQQFTFKHGMYWRGIRMTWRGALHYRLPLKRSEVPRYDVQVECLNGAWLCCG